jgi:hypothetical protein
LEIRQRTTGFPHFHRAGGELINQKGDKKNDEKTEFQLTDPDHFKHDEDASVASLRK